MPDITYSMIGDEARVLVIRLPKFGVLTPKIWGHPEDSPQDVRPLVFWESYLQNLQKVWELIPKEKKVFIINFDCPLGSFWSQYSNTPAHNKNKPGQEHSSRPGEVTLLAAGRSYTLDGREDSSQPVRG
jgi:hypothetical protein